MVHLPVGKKKEAKYKGRFKVFTSCSLLIHLELNYGAQESGLPFERTYFEIEDIFLESTGKAHHATN